MTITAWEYIRTQELTKRNSCALCICHTGYVTTEFALRLRELILPPNSIILFNRGRPFDACRNILADEGSKHAEWIIFLDSDVIPPKDFALKLLRHKLPIVSGLYRAKKKGFLWSAWIRKNNEIQQVSSFEKGLFEAYYIGMGLCLIHKDVFTLLKKSNPKLPYFLWTKDSCLDIPPEYKGLSEDFFFCERVRRELKMKIYVDTEVIAHHAGGLKLIEEGYDLLSI